MEMKVRPTAGVQLMREQSHDLLPVQNLLWTVLAILLIEQKNNGHC